MSGTSVGHHADNVTGSDAKDHVVDDVEYFLRERVEKQGQLTRGAPLCCLGSRRTLPDGECQCFDRLAQLVGREGSGGITHGREAASLHVNV